MTLTKKIILLLVVDLILLVAMACAQTVSPVTSEFKGPKAKGEVTVTNNGLIPVSVVLEPRSLISENGEPRFLPLNGVTLDLSDQSVKLGAKQVHTFSYTAQCDHLPCAFTVFARISGPPSKEGISVAVHLPSTVYLCSQKKGCRESILRGLGLLK